jgi:hypothetical protein
MQKTQYVILARLLDGKTEIKPDWLKHEPEAIPAQSHWLRNYAELRLEEKEDELDKMDPNKGGVPYDVSKKIAIFDFEPENYFSHN